MLCNPAKLIKDRIYLHKYDQRQSKMVPKSENTNEMDKCPNYKFLKLLHFNTK